MGRTTQNELTDALTSAMSAIADSSAQSKDATLTIEAEVVEVIDEGLGTYKVKYLGNQFEATTAHTEVTYSIGDMVYVVVPNGNFDKNKVILSPVNPSAAGYATTALTSSGNTYINISDNLFDNVNGISMSTWKPIEANKNRNLATITTNFKSLFKASLKDSRTFNFSCKIRTDIEKERRSRGNYGLELHLPVLQDINGISTLKDYVVKVDVNNINGDPYNLQTAALQNIYFTLPEDMELYSYEINQWSNRDIPWIGYFVKDFLGEDQTKPDDIFITDIQLFSVLEISEENMPGYYVVIQATEGTSFLSGRTGDEKTLSILTFLNGKLTKNNAFACYWFKENIGINRNSNKYHRLGGIGWEILNEVKETTYLEDGKPIYQYVTNNYTQKILQNDIHYDTVFKCVLAKDIDTEKPIIKTATVTIKNLQNDALIELTTESGSTIFSRGIGNVILQLKYHESTITDVVQSNYNVGYYWQKIDKFGNIIEDFEYEIIEFNKQIDDTYYTKIKCPVNDIDEVNIFKCTVYIEINKQRLIINQVIGTVSLMITIGQYLNGHIEVINGNKLYKYDADGNSPMSDGQYSGPLSDFITEIDPISIKLYKGDGSEFTADEYAVTDITWLIPINSMIIPPILTSSNTGDIPVVDTGDGPSYDETSNPGYYTISGKYNTYNQLNYRIATTYNYSKTNNTIIIKASTPSTILKETISEAVKLTFLKDGEGGTNGTSFSAVIVDSNNYAYGEKGHKFQLVYTEDTDKYYIFDPGAEETPYKIFTRSYFNIECYEQGVISNSIVDKKLTIFNQQNNTSSTPFGVYFDNYHYLQITDNYNGDCFIIQAEVTCNSSRQNAPTIIYAYYPVEVTKLPYESYLDIFIPYFKNGYVKVLYGSDGSNPKYDQKSSFKFSDYYSNDLLTTDYFNCYWTASSSFNINIRSQGMLERNITPVTKFDAGFSNNYITASLTLPEQGLNHINNELSRLTGQKTIKNQRKEYYQTLQNNIGVFIDFNNSYHYYKNLLMNTTSFYLMKTNLVKVLNELLNEANEIQSISNEYKKKEDESVDIKVTQIYNAIINKINSLNRLNILCSQLGVDNVINQIKSITPESLKINKITYGDNLPERDCYYTINNSINLYNNTIDIYSNYLDLLNDSEILSEETVTKTVFTWLQNFASSNRLDNLTKSYQGYNEECYRYSGLIKAIEGRVNSATEQVDTYSYNLIIENILDPIYNDLIWYISFANGEGYLPIIEQIDNEIDAITNNINILNNFKTIALNILYYNKSVTCTRPIVMTYNRYEMSFLNGWDGNKLQTTDGYIIAPQIGAGIKNNDNSFTGIVLGTKQIKENTDGQTGLFGYNYGIQTLFLNSRDGSASFGEKGAGQVIIDPSTKKAIIKSGNYNDNQEQIYERVYPTNSNYTSPAELGYFESVLNDTGTAYIYVETTDTYVKSHKAYYKRTDANGGMLIDLTTPEIKFGTGNFKVTKEGHITAKGGGEIAGWIIDDNNLYSKATGENRITIHSGDGTGHWEEGTYVYDYPKIFTGTHTELESTNKGFYLGPDGLSISGKYGERVGDYYYERTSHFELNMTGNPKLYSGNHESLNAIGRGFYLGQDGFSISNGSSSRFEISTTGQPKLFSNSHDKLTSTTGGFYLSSDGLSIGSKVYIDNYGKMRLGYQATNEDESFRHCWTIDGAYSNSSISYGTKGSSGSVYIGTDEITLGANFSVNNAGKLTAKDAEIKGKIEANNGEIAGWKISTNTLSSANGKIKLNSGGENKKFVEGPNAYIDLEGGGDFVGCHINAANVCFSANKIWTTRDRNGTLLYEGKDYELRFWPNNEYQIRLKWINGLLIEHEVIRDG